MNSKFRKSIEIEIYEDENATQPSVLTEDLNELLQRLEEAKYTRIRTYHHESGNLFEDAYYKGKAKHRDPEQGPAFTRYNPVKGHPVMEEFIWEGKLHRIGDFSWLTYDWETGALRETCSMIRGEFEPQRGRGSLITVSYTHLTLPTILLV